jgi:hypothetical protein
MNVKKMKMKIESIDSMVFQNTVNCELFGQCKIVHFFQFVHYLTIDLAGKMAVWSLENCISTLSEQNFTI